MEVTGWLPSGIGCFIYIIELKPLNSSARKYIVSENASEVFLPLMKYRVFMKTAVIAIYPAGYRLSIR
jgi:hypothetical protein